MLVISKAPVHSPGALLQVQAVCTAKKLVAGDNSGFVDPTTTTNEQGLDMDMDISVFSILKPNHPQHWVTQWIAVLNDTSPASQVMVHVTESSHRSPLTVPSDGSAGSSQILVPTYNVV